MRRRFFVETFRGQHAEIRGEPAHHLARVLRAEPGQLYELSDGQAVWLGRIEHVAREAVEFALVEQLPAPLPKLHAVLLLAIVKFDRFEWALEKATELGVSEIVPLAAARSERQLVAAATKRSQRWQKILLEAAQQSRRLAPPMLHPTARPAAAFSSAASGGASAPQWKILLSERPNAPSLRAAVESRGVSRLEIPQVAIAIGPEGGWTDEELASARAAEFAEASLGSNILRTETAVTAALAILNYALGE